MAGTEGIQTQFLHADDCAVAFAGVLGQAHSIGKTYNVCAKEMHTWGDYYRAAMAVLGREVPIVAAPTALLVAAGAASIAIEDNFAHSRVLSPKRICRDVPSFRAGGSCGGVRLGEGLRRMIAAMNLRDDQAAMWPLRRHRVGQRGHVGYLAIDQSWQNW